jgi:hypothetical protein
VVLRHHESLQGPVTRCMVELQVRGKSTFALAYFAPKKYIFSVSP